jgi:hypothetical protein
MVQTLIVTGLIGFATLPVALASEPTDLATAEAKLEGLFGPRHGNVRGLPASGVYYAPLVRGANGELRRDNSSAFHLSGHDLHGFESSLARFLDRIERDDADGDLMVTGVPMWSAFGRDLERQLRASLVRQGLDPRRVRITMIYRPMGRGLRRAAEELRYWFPMAQDYETPSFAEMGVATPASLINEAATAAYAFSNFSLGQATPMVAGHFGLLAGLSALGRTNQNWMLRSKTKVDNFLKQMSVGTLFIVNYNLWTGGLQDPGQFVLDQGLTAVTQTAFFWLTFGQGLWRWDGFYTTAADGTRLQNPEDTRKARNLKAVVQPAVFFVSGPLLAWASTSSDVVASLGPIDVNPGQIALAAAAVVGTIFMRPWLLDPASEGLDRWVQRNDLGKIFVEPWRRARAWLSGEASVPRGLRLASSGATPGCERLFSD